MSIVLTDDQQTIYDDVVKNVKSYKGRYGASITGYAGTGKSTLISKLINDLSSTYKIAVTTPTHKANGVIRNMLFDQIPDDSDADILLCTIHSFLGLKLVYKQNNQVLVHDKTSKNSNVMVDILIVDECSMVSDDLYSYIMVEASRVRRAIIFIGDECQLPPVDVNKSTTQLSKTFGFGAQHRLTKVLRQAENNPIISLATSIRKCIGGWKNPIELLNKHVSDNAIIKITDQNLLLSTFFETIKPTKNSYDELFENINRYKILAYTNYKVDTYNKIIRDQLYPDQKENELIEGEPIIFEEVTESCMYHVQDVIICPKIYKDYFFGIECWRFADENGSQVYAVGPETKKDLSAYLDLVVQAIEAKAINPLTKLPFCWQDYYVIKKRFVVVAYPYALTIHKSQGSTFETIWLDTGYLGTGQSVDDATRILYTGITRPKKSIVVLS